MNLDTEQDEAMCFAVSADAVEAAAAGAPWKILIVDDEEEIHRVTQLALGAFTLHGRPLYFFDAYSGSESVEIMRREPDMAMVLMDVVMETDHAGLDAVTAIREALGNRLVRIVLRTGQPGQAPESDVVRRFDINDYKEKTELTAKKLFTLMHTGLSHYRELVAMEENRRGLRKIINASASIFEQRSLAQFARGVLQQLAGVLYARRDAVIVGTGGVATVVEEQGLRVLAGTGEYAKVEGQIAETALDPTALGHIRNALSTKAPVVDQHHFAGHFSTSSGAEHVVYLSSESPFEPGDSQLVELFCRNVAIAYENLSLHQQISEAQQRMVMLLCAAIEERDPDLHNHVARVSEYSVLLGRLAGLSQDETDSLAMAAAVHDLGKIGVPDSILNKPGALTLAERTQMQTHVERGREILHGQHRGLLQAAALVVAQHHEHWNGGGYPLGIAGDQIHIFGRIAGIADVFDALTTRRCYKDPWPIPRVIAYFQEQRGRQFDPKLVDLLVAHIDEFLLIQRRLAE